MQPLHHRQVAIPSGAIHDFPGAALRAVGMQPLHRRQVAIPRGLIHGTFGAALRAIDMKPLQDGKITNLFSSIDALVPF